MPAFADCRHLCLGARLLSVMAFCLSAFPAGAAAQDGSALRTAIAALVADDPDLRQFYEETAYKPLWTGGGGRGESRRRALFDALGDAVRHGLPASAYDPAGLRAAVAGAADPATTARAEVALTRTFAAYARDVQSGVLTPRRVDAGIRRDAPRRATAATLAAFATSAPRGFIEQLPPQSAEYRRLMGLKLDLERALGTGGWGPKVPAGTLRRGMSGPGVATLRQRLAALGYGRAGSSAMFGDDLEAALVRFQRDQGLATDGVAGPATLEQINKTPADRLGQVIAAMERERWMNFPRGARHIWVNIPDFTAHIIDGDRVTFETRAVVGRNRSTHRTPEFSDVMEFMVINPTWNVPYSIAIREYLPMLKRDPAAVPHLRLLDRNGNRVSRGAVDFTALGSGNFPYRLAEPPGAGNALGRVKFMFPNPHNVYLHDTPHKALFERVPRAYSHGCVRLNDPTGFARTLLARQTGNPDGFFRARLDTGRETAVRLERPVPVHLVYRTVFTRPGGAVQYRPDIYGRDAALFARLAQAGVSLQAAGG